MADKAPIRFGILGCAEIARKVSRAIKLAPNAAIQAIGSRSIEKARRYAESNGYPPSARIYGSYEEVLDDGDVDALYIPLPTSLHLRYAVLAAEKKKHVLLEKPVALSVLELDKILEACETNGVQFMDCTFWMHHPRTAKMKEFLSDQQLFGQLKVMHSCFTLSGTGEPDFLQNNIRVKADLDALSALGDLGPYQGPLRNEEGALLACGASLFWEDGKIATFHCSYLYDMALDITAIGTKGTLHINDFVIPYQETMASFSTGSQSKFTDMIMGWTPLPSQQSVTTEIPQDACMVKMFSSLVQSVEQNGSKPEKMWPSITRKTQLMIDAIKASIEKSCETVEVIP
ncbi:hypothetical protein Ancab_038624 [Ancistrocladus abbreviatus]